MASKDQLRKIAIYCDEYTPRSHEDRGLKSSVEEKRDSCTNCIHFTERGFCDLDLIDKVLSSLSMEQDLKS